jgi:hypothetical protein
MLANLGQTAAFWVREARSPFKLTPENTILRGWIFIAWQKLLITGSGDIRLKALPIRGMGQKWINENVFGQCGYHDRPGPRTH